MSDIHNALRRGNLSDALTRALGATRDDGGLERFGETLTPTLNLWSLPEWAWLRGEQLWAAFGSVAGVAAETAFVAVVNPATSGLLAVVEAASVRLSVAGAAYAGITTEAAIVAKQDAVGSSRVRDRRAGGVTFVTRVSTSLGSGAGTLVAAAVAMEEIRHNDGQEIYSELLCCPVVLRPGDGFVIEANTALTSIGVNYRGRDRFAMPGELE